MYFLFLQAILFYIPRWLWKNWEAGKISALKMDLDLGIITEAEKRQKKKLLLDYLYANMKNHNFWAYRYFFCEFLALLNVLGEYTFVVKDTLDLSSGSPICNARKWALNHWYSGYTLFAGQMFLMDRFFDGTFLTFGIEVISFAERDQEDRIDPMVYIFPRMTKCTFHKFGSSGEIEKHDAMCILPLNIVNEKIYIFLWFWMLLLLALTFLVVVYRVFVIFSPRMRAYLLYIRYRLIKKECINVIIKKTKMGDWFLLYMLGQNIDSIIFKELVHELARKLGYHNKDIYDS